MPDSMPEYTFPISPIAASRPRLSRRGAYFTGPYKKFRQECAEIVYEVLGADFELLEGPLSVDIELFVTQPKRTKLDSPKADIDNFVKSILDVLNGKLWVDDSQIIKLHATKQWAAKGEEGYFTVGVDLL
tara:strand:+ start:1408 stop:1797 length:390 start_codon:yes stop_codon:yes gene_type:complete